jgi:transposase
VALEACCGAHHLGRRFLEQGHGVRLMPPEYVRPYVKAQKKDDRDAEAIAEAATRPTFSLAFGDRGSSHYRTATHLSLNRTAVAYSR